MELNTYLLFTCALVYLTLSAVIAIQARQKANKVLAVCCSLTALSVGTSATVEGSNFSAVADFLDLIRVLSWYCYLLYLYRLSGAGSPRQIRGFSTVPLLALTAALLLVLTGFGARLETSYPWSSAIRLMTCISELLLIENLYLNLSERSRWHIALPCILLGGIVCFDILVIADAIIFHRLSAPLISGRTIAMIIIAPLLALAASRGQRWTNTVRLSRTAVFHSATLILSGSVLLSLAVAGEVLRHLDAKLGWLAELTLLFTGAVGLLLCFSSRSARSIFDRMVMPHFFADRYDYRAQWLSCIRTLSGKTRIEESDLQTRAIQAVADVVNSPSGSLFIRDDTLDAMVWARSWNVPTSTHLPFSNSAVKRVISDQGVIDFSEGTHRHLHEDMPGELAPVWLAVPLIHSSDVIGVVLVSPPRTAFRTDQEVFDLLTILGQEVGTYIAEQRSTEAVLLSRSLHDYGRRFSFVAHDVKNVSSQLALLLRNAEIHLQNPEFQQDMLETVRSSVKKIDRLIKRLDDPSFGSSVEVIPVVATLKTILSSFRHTAKFPINLEHGSCDGWISMTPESFETAVLHLLNNALEASSPVPIVIRVTHSDDDITIDIIDQGVGMSPEFVRDELFRPFRTSKGSGSGIGAFQARELIHEAGGQLVVTSEVGNGTAMRLNFKRASETITRVSVTDLPKASRGLM